MNDANKEVDIQTALQDLLGLQKAIPDIEKSSSVKHSSANYNYADLPTILATVQPKINEYGFILQFTHEHISDTMITCTAILLHAPTGEAFETSVYMDTTSMHRQSRQQAIASAITYGKRIAIASLLALRNVEPDTLEKEQLKHQDEHEKEKKKEHDEMIQEATKYLGEAKKQSIITEQEYTKAIDMLPQSTPQVLKKMIIKLMDKLTSPNDIEEML